MSTVLAVDSTADNITFVVAELPATGSATLKAFRQFSLAELQERVADPSALNNNGEQNGQNGVPVSGGASPGEVNESFEPKNSYLTPLEKLLGIEIDSSIAIFKPGKVLFEYLNLPFKDKSRLEQIVPLQLQDSLPFPVDNFLIDTQVVRQNPEGTYQLLSSLTPENEVADLLFTLSQLGIDPKILTTRSAALSGLSHFFPGILEGSYSLLCFGQNTAVLTVVVDNSPTLVREFPEFNHLSVEDFVNSVLCSLARVEKDTSADLSQIFTLAVPKPISDDLRRRNIFTRDLSLTDRMDSGNVDLKIPVDELSWAIGLFGYELALRQRKPIGLLNLRVGKYSYRPTLKHILSAFHNVRYFVWWAVLMFAFWFASLAYTKLSLIWEINSRISNQVASAFPGTPVASGDELAFVDRELDAIRTELESFGSLSSLSPLESLRELTRVIDPGLEISIDQFRISATGLIFSASSPKIDAWASVQSALEKMTAQFCRVKVNQRQDRVPGTGHRRMDAEATFVGFCED